MKTTKIARPRGSRTGTACVELAITLPILLFVSFSAIEICNLIAMQQTAFRVAFDSAREVSQHELSDKEVIRFVSRKLQSIGVDGEVDLKVSPSSLPKFEQVTINIALDNSNSFSFVNFFRGSTTTASATAIRQFDSTSPPTPSFNSSVLGKGYGKRKR